TVLLRPVCRLQLDLGQLELVALEVELALLDVVLRARDVVFGPQALPAGDDLAVDARGVLVERQVAGSFELVDNRHAFGGRAQTDLAGSVLADGLRVVELRDRRVDEEALAAGQLGDDDRVRRRARTEGLPSVDRVDLRARHELLEVVRGRGLAFAAVAAQVLRREDVRVQRLLIRLGPVPRRVLEVRLPDGLPAAVRDLLHEQVGLGRRERLGVRARLVDDARDVGLVRDGPVGARTAERLLLLGAHRALERARGRRLLGRGHLGCRHLGRRHLARSRALRREPWLTLGHDRAPVLLLARRLDRRRALAVGPRRRAA